MYSYHNKLLFCLKCRQLLLKHDTYYRTVANISIPSQLIVQVLNDQFVSIYPKVLSENVCILSIKLSPDFCSCIALVAVVFYTKLFLFQKVNGTKNVDMLVIF